MTHAELVNLTLGIHGSVLIAAIAAYYKFGDRTEVMNRSLSGTDTAMQQIRRRLSAELIATLRPIFEPPGIIQSVIVNPASPAYAERATHPLDSERFRESLRLFVEVNSETMVDCQLLARCRSAWLFWARVLSWSIVLLLIWEVLVVGALAIIDKASGVTLPDSLIRWLAAPTGLLAICCLVPLPCLLWHHDRINKIRATNDLI